MSSSSESVGEAGGGGEARASSRRRNCSERSLAFARTWATRFELDVSEVVPREPRTESNLGVELPDNLPNFDEEGSVNALDSVVFLLDTESPESSGC